MKKYIQSFGKFVDFCLVAKQNEKLLGPIWIRLINGYGFIDTETPEMSMAFLMGYRGNGIEKKLLSDMIDRLKDNQVQQISLSVDKKNFAQGLYKEFGFED